MDLIKRIALLSKLSPDSALGRIVRVPLRLMPRDTIVNVRSGLNVGARWIVGSSDHGCWIGHYESAKQAAIKGALKPGMNVMDIGANAGFYTLAFARAVGERGHVWAFEPFADNVRNLLRHVAMNGLDNVTVVQAAVANTTGIAGFCRATSNAMGMLGNESDYLVPTVSIDELRRERDIPVPDLVKIDVEGSEAQVLRGARATLAERRTTVFLALHGQEPERDCIEMFSSLDYEIRYFDNNLASDRPLKSDEIVATPRSR